MAFPITIAVSPGRCGTVFLHSVFKENALRDLKCYHELIHPNVAAPAKFFRPYEVAVQQQMLAVPKVMSAFRRILDESTRQPVVEFGWPSMSLLPALAREAPTRVKVLVLHRHPLESAASHAVKGHYSKNRSQAWAISPFHLRVFPSSFQDGWGDLTGYEKELFRWLQVVQYGLEVGPRLKIPHLTVRAKDVFSSVDVIHEIGDFCEVELDSSLNLTQSRNRTSSVDRETRPIGDEWRRTCAYREVGELSEALDYDLSEENLIRLVRKYQFPDGFWPRLRRFSGYWSLRASLGHINSRLRSAICGFGSRDSAEPAAAPR